jgi:hypothetical protein
MTSDLFWDVTQRSGNSVPTFQDNLSVPSLKAKKKKGCPETLVRKYNSMLCNIQEERRSLFFPTLKIKVATFFRNVRVHLPIMTPTYVYDMIYDM